MNNNIASDHNLEKDSSNSEKPLLDILIKDNRSSDKLLCIHCGRTESNDIRCLGMCVADSDY